MVMRIAFVRQLFPFQRSVHNTDSKARWRFWPPWLITVLIIVQLALDKTMVKLSEATISGTTAASEGVLQTSTILKCTGKLEHLARRDVDQQVLRELHCRFAEYSHVDVHIRMIHGKTLFDEIKDKKLERLAKRCRISTSWWQALRCKWQRVT